MILTLLEDSYSICKFPPQSQIPAWALQSDVFFLSKTADELSVICSSAYVPVEISCNVGWCCFRVDGDLEFEQVGVVASVSSPVADAGISLFLVSTHDRDYVLVHERTLEHVIRIYRQSGFVVNLTV